jgi:3'-phosphoadenosine 5'-phosphosulfate sulfotransferase (PAPS reductase)/FAD synthetase
MQAECNVVSISGGKDSTATLLVALERGAPNLSLIFADTGHEHAKTYEHIDYLEARIGLPIRRVKADFSHRIANKRLVVQDKWRREMADIALAAYREKLDNKG